MGKRLWLHIGAEKTGTTTIQSCLAENRLQLQRHGILYPKALGTVNHVALTAYALDDHKMEDDTRVVCGVKRNSLGKFREDLRRSFIREVGASLYPTIILSNEHCSSRLRTRDEVHRVRAFCGLVSDDIKIIFYIRNPVDFLASWYSTSVAGGSTKNFPLPPFPKLYSMVDVRGILDLWAEVFGIENIVLRRFERRRFPHGDLIEDFLGVFQASELQLTKPKPQNESLSLSAISFLREFNKHVPRIQNGSLNAMRGPLIEALRSINAGARFTLPQSEADQINNALQEDHRYIANRFFGESGNLFEPATAVSAAGSMDIELGSDGAIAISAELWKFIRKRNINLSERLKRLGG